jgi:hypothetical protein
MELVQGILSATDCLCLPDARSLLGEYAVYKVIAGYRVPDPEGEYYFPVWSGSDEAELNYCQICGIRLADARGE